MKQSNLTAGGTSATPPPIPPAAVEPNPDILDPASVARILGVSEADVMEEITSGNLTAKKIGSSYRVTRASLDAFLSH
jgi:excisionase family DNA binding protein